MQQDPSSRWRRTHILRKIKNWNRIRCCWTGQWGAWRTQQKTLLGRKEAWKTWGMPLLRERLPCGYLALFQRPEGGPRSRWYRNIDPGFEIKKSFLHNNPVPGTEEGPLFIYHWVNKRMNRLTLPNYANGSPKNKWIPVPGSTQAEGDGGKDSYVGQKGQGEQK